MEFIVDEVAGGRMIPFSAQPQQRAAAGSKAGTVRL
jgi:hypothetical protein